MAEAAESWSNSDDNNLCLRAIAIAANRKRMTELGDILSPTQIFEFLTKTALGTLNLVDIPNASEATHIGHGTVYCSAEGCHFQTEMAGVEMAGEVGFVFHFPSAQVMDNQIFPCKLRGPNSAKSN